MKELLSIETTKLIKELTDAGWEFMLHWGDHTGYCGVKGSSWEADFTRRKEEGKWDNHKSGYADTPDKAVHAAYENIKNGVKLKKG